MNIWQIVIVSGIALVSLACGIQSHALRAGTTTRGAELVRWGLPAAVGLGVGTLWNKTFFVPGWALVIAVVAVAFALGFFVHALAFRSDRHRRGDDVGEGQHS